MTTIDLALDEAHHRAMRLAMLGLCLAVGVAGCGLAQTNDMDGSLPGVDGGAVACTSSRMCPGQVCDTTLGQCVDCVTAGDCTAGLRCVHSVCVPPAASCTSDRDCSAMGLVCDPTGHECVECVQTADCASDQFCSTSGTTAGTCVPRVCATGETRCADATSIAMCSADGSGFGASVACDGTMRCVGTACVPGDGGVDAGPADSGRALDAGPPDAGPLLYHGWTCPVAACDTSHYDSTLPTAIGGVYPYLASDSPACRLWKLAATICTTPPRPYGSVDVTNNWQCPTSGGFTDPTFGTYCPRSPTNPGLQVVCIDCTGFCGANCPAPPLLEPFSLRDCLGVEVEQQ